MLPTFCQVQGIQKLNIAETSCPDGKIMKQCNYEETATAESKQNLTLCYGDDNYLGRRKFVKYPLNASERVTCPMLQPFAFGSTTPPL